MKEKKEKAKSCKRSMIGGQALMEGVMMRGRRSMAMAVRAPDGSILVETTRLKGRRWYNRVPIVRGVVSFVQSLVSGVSTLMRSAEVSSPDEETPGKGWMAFAVILGVVLAVGLFILLPSVLNTLLFEKAIKLDAHFSKKTAILLSSLFEGILRILIFVLYLVIVSRMKDIRRTFMYHGAEHRTINCYEKGYDMTVENVQKCSTRHNRCGTTFLFFVMIVSILMFSLANWGLSYFSWGSKMLVKMGVRLALLPIVAGLSYELLRGLARLPDNTFTNILRAPGLALQRLTTYPPEDDMAEVALKSFLTVLEMDEDDSIAPVRFGEYNLRTVRRDFERALAAKGLDEREAAAETDWILCYAIGCKRGELASAKKLNLGEYKTATEVFGRRLQGEPLDYILGESEFFGHRLKVTPAVLIPRMETERLAEEAIKRIGEEEKTVLDLCTGSGCLALAIAKATRAKVTATDLSEEAINVARENVKDCDVQLLCGDLFGAVEGTFDVIVTNPPYIKRDEIDALQPEVLAQPRLALDGGSDGLTFYRRIAKEYGAYLNDGGVLLAEIGYDQGEAVKEIFAPVKVEIIKDYDGNDRVIAVEKAKTKKA